MNSRIRLFALAATLAAAALPVLATSAASQPSFVAKPQTLLAFDPQALGGAEILAINPQPLPPRGDDAVDTGGITRDLRLAGGEPPTVIDIWTRKPRAPGVTPILVAPTGTASQCYSWARKPEVSEPTPMLAA